MNDLAKKRGRSGAIRFEAIGPFAIFVVLVGLYFAFLFDFHLRKILESAGTWINGAEVNIAELDIAWKSGRFTVGDIQVTDRQEPEYDRVRIGSIGLDWSWDALLRAKF